MPDEKPKGVPGDEELKEFDVVSNDKKAGKRAGAVKCLRITAWCCGILLALLLLLFLCRDFLIETGVRHIGTFVTGTEVRIASFKSSLNGSVELKDIKVANPAGYKNPYAFEIERIYVKLDTSTLTSDEPVIETVEVTGVSVDMEIKSSSRSNISEIQANVEKVAGTGKKDEKTAPQDENEENDAKNAPAPLIKKIALTAMKISISSSTFNTSVPIPLTPVYLKNIGGKGQPLGETLFMVFQKFIGSINAVCGTLIGGFEAIGSAGKALTDGIVDGTKSLTDAGKNIGSDITDGAKNISDGISGLFNKKK